MITSHLFRPSWFYKLFLTEKLIDVLKTKNNLSIYELLGKNCFPAEIFSTSPCRPMTFSIVKGQ